MRTQQRYTCQTSTLFSRQHFQQGDLFYTINFNPIWKLKNEIRASTATHIALGCTVYTDALGKPQQREKAQENLLFRHHHIEFNQN